MAKPRIILTDFETGAEVNLSPDADAFPAILDLPSGEKYARRTRIDGKHGECYLVKESIKTVRKLFGI